MTQTIIERLPLTTSVHLDPVADSALRVAFRLVFVSMPITIGLITLIDLLRLPMGAALLLGSILSPSDRFWPRKLRWRIDSTPIDCDSA